VDVTQSAIQMTTGAAPIGDSWPIDVSQSLDLYLREKETTSGPGLLLTRSSRLVDKESAVEGSVSGLLDQPVESMTNRGRLHIGK
jgi:hypothetical protein